MLPHVAAYMSARNLAVSIAASCRWPYAHRIYDAAINIGISRNVVISAARKQVESPRRNRPRRDGAARWGGGSQRAARRPGAVAHPRRRTATRHRKDSARMHGREHRRQLYHLRQAVVLPASLSPARARANVNKSAGIGVRRRKSVLGTLSATSRA